MSWMLRRSQVSCANCDTPPAKIPTIKKGSPRPRPKARANKNPYKGLACAAATDSNSNKGAAEVPKLKIKP